MPGAAVVRGIAVLEIGESSRHLQRMFVHGLELSTQTLKNIQLSTREMKWK